MASFKGLCGEICKKPLRCYTLSNKEPLKQLQKLLLECGNVVTGELCSTLFSTLPPVCKCESEWINSGLSSTLTTSVGGMQKLVRATAACQDRQNGFFIDRNQNYWLFCSSSSSTSRGSRRHYVHRGSCIFSTLEILYKFSCGFFLFFFFLCDFSL